MQLILLVLRDGLMREDTPFFEMPVRTLIWIFLVCDQLILTKISNNIYWYLDSVSYKLNKPIFKVLSPPGYDPILF